MNKHDETMEKLNKVVTDRHFIGSSSDWQKILKEIPGIMAEIITKIYETEMNKEIVVDPLSPDKKITIQEYQEKVLYNLGSFQDWPPFTIVRISEILIKPNESYSTSEKFLRALENITSVSSSINEFDRDLEVDKKESKDEIVVTDESKVMLLSKIDWLTEEDKEEIQSEGYLNGALSVSNGIFERYGNEEIDEDEEDDEDYVDEEYEDELIRKRKVEKESNEPIVKESPEKKIKTGSDESLEESDTTFEEDKMQVD